ncbi:MAG: UDP-N-acetylmuramoyl-tripeptide--D-alanyl-D-alanine ligase [Lachnospiraceae bacterium]|nr:UDP-N-acetylmuramoyl-tripeptide--D-alanyl-D-alanine ligase [Lachnospiraceae bacterium]
MENMTVNDIVKATGGSLLVGALDVPVCDFCIDSRDVKEGDLFVPIIGEKVDGHKFIPDIINTAAATLASEDIDLNGIDKPVIRVEDSVKAMQDIAHYIRNRISPVVVGVTGSVGKTTTREMIAAALSTGKKTYQTQRNFNSQIGLPIAISRIGSDCEAAVLEMGMSEKGQIEILSDLAKPHMAVVTTIGVAHIEFLGSQENIRTEKLSIISHMDKDGILFLNGDDPMLSEMKDKMPCKTIFYGTSDWCDFYAKDIEFGRSKTSFTVVHGDEETTVTLNSLGKHNVANCVAAMAVAYENGIPMEISRDAFPDFEGQRLKIIEREGKFTIIDDTYNASTTSMKASIDVLSDRPCYGKRYAVLGDMFELGPDEVKYHLEVGAYAAKRNINEVICVGELAKNYKKAIDEADTKVKAYSFMDKEEAAFYLVSLMKPEDVVLVKASNGMKLSSVVDILKSS